MDQSTKIDEEKLGDEKAKRQDTCRHERVKKKRLGGMDTGDKICEDCGKIIEG